VTEDGRVIDVPGGKQRTLLAMLLLHANEVVSSDRLIDAVWEREPPAAAAKALQVYVSHLRKALGRDRLETKPPGYRVRIADGELDLGRFQRLVAERRFEDALALWRGPPLSDFAYQHFAQTEIARLEEARLTCLEERIEARLAEGCHASLVGELEALVGMHPLRERLRGQLMLALYRTGRQAESLQVYQDARRALVDGLGIEPSRALRDLHQRVLSQDPVLELAPRSEPEAEVTRAAFVGRAEELAELVDGLEEAIAGHGRLFLLVGEPGIGKSRLADELTRLARARGTRVLVGRCWEAGGAPAYWPWVQSLRAYVREEEPASLRAQLGTGGAHVAQILPELRELFPDLSEPPALESEGARFGLFDATAQFLRNASARRPILLVLDDLHAADTPSLLLLQYLAREAGSMRILLLGALRDVDPIPGEALTGMLAEVAREPVTRRISLGGLNERAVAEYVESTAAEIASPELVAALHGETDGNPLFLAETVRLLALEGVRPESPGIAITIPQSVRDVIARRLAHLSADCKRLLALASVLGREFALTPLARAGGVSENELLDVLDEAMIARVVSDVPGASGRLRFAHVLIRDTLYEELTTVRRVRLHRLVVETLEGLYGPEPGSHLAELAHHAVAGSSFDKALVYARTAGDHALDLLAYEEAARLYETALGALDLDDPRNERVRCELLLSLGEAETRAGDTPAARRTFLEAATLAQRLQLSYELARAAAGYGGRIVWGRADDDQRLVPLLEDALLALRGEDVELRARLLARLAGALRDEHSRDRRDALSREAVELARRTRNPAALAHALDGRVPAIIAPDTISECLALADELRDVAGHIGDRERVHEGHFHRFVAQLVIGDVVEAEKDLAASSRITEELRQPAQLWQVRASQAMLALAAGRLTEAEELMQQALVLGERAQPGWAMNAYRFQRYTLGDFRGQFEEAEPAIRDSAAAYPARPVFRCALAHIHARLGLGSDAQRALDALARDAFSTVPFDMEWLVAMSLLAETCSIVGDLESSAVLHGMLLPWAAFNAADPVEGVRGSVSRYLGLLAATMERWDDAACHYEDAIAMNERMGARPWLAYTQSDYGHMLRDRGNPEDTARADELLAAAEETYRELGMASDARGDNAAWTPSSFATQEPPRSTS
jgi:DNA-binding SARP family transcriptional activator/tetratricopeptide (TPR) repeat protein